MLNDVLITDLTLSKQGHAIHFAYYYQFEMEF